MRSPLDASAETAPSGGESRRRVRLEGPLITANERGWCCEGDRGWELGGVGEGSHGEAAGKINSSMENFSSQAPPVRGSRAVPAASLHTLTVSKHGRSSWFQREEPTRSCQEPAFYHSASRGRQSWLQDSRPKLDVMRWVGAGGCWIHTLPVTTWFHFIFLAHPTVANPHSRSNQGSQFPGTAHTSTYGTVHFKTDWQPQTAAPTVNLISIQDSQPMGEVTMTPPISKYATQHRLNLKG